MLKLVADGDKDLFAEVCEQDFYFFCRWCLTLGQFRCKDPYLVDPYDPERMFEGTPWLDHPWLFDRCREIQAEPDGMLDLWPRYHFKTALITQSYPLWELTQQPDLKFLLITYKIENVAESFLLQIKREQEINHLLHETWPDSFWQNPRSNAPEWSAKRLCLPRQLNPKEPTFQITSLKAGATSTHVDRRIWDDIVEQESVRSRAAIDATTELWKKFAGTVSDLTVDRAAGTHWAVNDTYRYTLDLGAFKLRRHDLYLEDGVTPVLRSTEWVEGVRLRMGSYNFAAQMRNKPVAGHLQTFDLGKLRYYDEDPEEHAKKTNQYILIDTAGGRKAKEGNDPDYTAMSCLGIGRGVPYYSAYIRDLYRDRMSFTRFMDILFAWVDKWRPLMVYIEQVGAMRDGELIANEMVSRGVNFRLKEIQERLKKEERIQRMQPFIESGRLYLPRGGIFGKMDGKKVDFLSVLKDDEMRDWNPITGALFHDDLLDTLAWIESPVVQVRPPEQVGGYDDDRLPGGAWQNRRFEDENLGALDPWAM